MARVTIVTTNKKLPIHGIVKLYNTGGIGIDDIRKLVKVQNKYRVGDTGKVGDPDYPINPVNEKHQLIARRINDLNLNANIRMLRKRF
jgi:hypothetical protein